MPSLQAAVAVGLGGVTNGGKTTMCRSLEQLFSSDKYNLRVKSLHLDDYFRPNDDPHHKHLDKFNHHDWDCLDALDIDRFIKDFQSIHFKCDLLLVEGFLIFNVPFPSEHHHVFNLAYYFHLSYEECRKRRLERNYDPPDPDGYFEGHIWNAYIKAKNEAFQKNKDVGLELVDTTKESFENIQNKIIKDIETTLKRVQKIS
jgi:uridine kinase